MMVVVNLMIVIQNTIWIIMVRWYWIVMVIVSTILDKDGFCDDGCYGIYDEEGNQVPINLMCPEFNFDEGDCEMIDEDCTLVY